MSYDREYYLRVRETDEYQVRRALTEQERRDRKNIEAYKQFGLQYFKNDTRRKIDAVWSLLSDEEKADYTAWTALTKEQRWTIRHGRKHQKEHHNQTNYGISTEEADEIKAIGCYVCGTEENLCVDHNHETGKVRGCLCKRCNSALGFLDDNILKVRELYRYMKLYD